MIQNRLSEVMGRRRVKVSQLSREAGVSRNSVHALYHDAAVGIQFETLDRLCKFLNVQVGDLLVYVPDEEEQQ